MTQFEQSNAPEKNRFFKYTNNLKNNILENSLLKRTINGMY